MGVWKQGEFFCQRCSKKFIGDVGAETCPWCASTAIILQGVVTLGIAKGNENEKEESQDRQAHGGGGEGPRRRYARRLDIDG